MTEDPFLWLEDIDGDAALAWVRERNARSQALLTAQPGFEDTRAALLGVLNSKERIPVIRRIGAYVYNLWQDDEHRRGLWRRTTLEDYAQPRPHWQIVLDLDALGAAEQESWVWGGAVAFGPQYRRCLLHLSRGGTDAVEVREFDLEALGFVVDGFRVPQAKTSVDWLDADTLYVASDFGPGSLTDSGYPRVVKRWARGTPLADAPTVFEGEPGDVSAWVSVDRTPGYERTLFGRSTDFYSTRVFLDGREIDKPADASLSFEREWLLLELRSDWTVGHCAFRAGSLLAANAQAYLAGERRFDLLFEPTATRSLAGCATTRSRVLLEILDNVVSRVEALQHDGRQWQRREIATPGAGNVSLASLHDPLLPEDPLAEQALVGYTDFLTPDSLLLMSGDDGTLTPLKRRPAYFDSTGMRLEQRHATSRDGTRVPYFVVWPRGAGAGGDHPTLLYGYGGFEVSLQPAYSGTNGRAWYARGGVYVVANIRGGGEFGPAWHQGAVGAHKQRSYDDFIAVAEDLVASGVTSPGRLGIMGGSNGGLLVAAVALQRPELFGAVVCQVPLLDMQRYHRLLAGASWQAEYGNPDRPDEWAWIAPYSPYQNVRPGVRYPRMLIATSTRDDRVHPGHARKMAARLEALGHPVLYYENIEGGHGGAADNEQRAHLMALEFSYLWMELGPPRSLALPAPQGGPRDGPAEPDPCETLGGSRDRVG